MTCESAVCINDDLSSRKTGVTLRTAYNESACRIDVDLGILIHKFSRDYCLDDVLLDVFLKILESYISAVLCGDNDCVDPLNLVVLVFNSNL